MKDVRRTLFFVFVLALVLRIGFIMLYDSGKMLSNNLYASDEFGYNEIARNFSEGKGFVTDDGVYARRGPVYPFFLAVVYFLFGHSFVAARFVQALVGSMTCLVVYFLGKELFGRKIGLIAAFLSAVYHPFILQPAYLLTEVLFTFLITTSLYFFLLYYSRRNMYFLFFGAICFGVSILCRGVIFYFSVCLLIWLMWIQQFELKRAIRASFVFILGIIIVVSPWIVRNYKIYNAFIPVSLETGISLYGGNNRFSTGGTGGRSQWGKDQFLPENIEVLFTPETDKRLSRSAFKYIINNRGRTLYLSFRKFVNMWRPFYADSRPVNKIITSVLYIPIIVLAAAGITLNLHKGSQKCVLVFCLLLYLTVIPMLTISVIRYRYPLMPFLIIFSAYSLISAKSLFQKKFL